VNYGELTRRVALFWAGETQAELLRDADPVAADLLAAFFDMHRNAVASDRGHTVAVGIDRFEWDVARKVADILRDLPAATRRERLNAMSASRRALVIAARGGTRNG